MSSYAELGASSGFAAAAWADKIQEEITVVGLAVYAVFTATRVGLATADAFLE